MRSLLPYETIRKAVRLGNIVETEDCCYYGGSALDDRKRGGQFMYFHASPTKGIQILEPRISNHGVPLIYFSTKRENVLVYLSNAVEKYGRETGFAFSGKWKKWGPYGFNQDGTLRIEEYYPHALLDTYQGVSGYIYAVETITASDFPLQIPDAAVSSEPTPVESFEYIPDAYEAILAAEKDGLISIQRYEDMREPQRAWMERTIREEYANATDSPEYRHFLEGKFPFIKQ